MHTLQVFQQQELLHAFVAHTQPPTSLVLWSQTTTSPCGHHCNKAVIPTMHGMRILLALTYIPWPTFVLCSRPMSVPTSRTYECAHI